MRDPSRWGRSEPWKVRPCDINYIISKWRKRKLKELYEAWGSLPGKENGDSPPTPKKCMDQWLRNPTPALQHSEYPSKNIQPGASTRTTQRASNKNPSPNYRSEYLKTFLFHDKSTSEFFKIPPSPRQPSVIKQPAGKIPVGWNLDKHVFCWNILNIW